MVLEGFMSLLPALSYVIMGWPLPDHVRRQREVAALQLRAQQQASPQTYIQAIARARDPYVHAIHKAKGQDQ